MPLRVQRTATFNKLLKKILKPYPRSKQTIQKFIDDKLVLNPTQGDKYPGFGSEIIVRKVRIGLSEYKIGKSNGLRLLYLLLVERQLIIPLTIYKKMGFKGEGEVKADVRKALKNVLMELRP